MLKRKMKKLWRYIPVFTVLGMASSCMTVCAQEEELQMGVTATVDGTELTFWQESTKIEDGVMYADYASFYENGTQQYELRIGVTVGLPEGSYKKTAGAGEEERFLVSLMLDPDAGVDSAYCLSNLETDFISNSSYELTVTESDILSGHYHGTFEGTAVLWKGSAQMEITDAEFDMLYNHTSPNYVNGGGAVSAGGAAGGGNVPVADPDVCTHCDGSGICSKCVGTGEDLCSCLGGSCPSCSGMGHKMVYTSDGLEFPDCRTCGGTGFHERCGGTGFLECTLCDGTGICTYCNGTGER